MYCKHVLLKALLSQNSTQIYNNGVNTSQQKYIHPIFYQTTEEI